MEKPLDQLRIGSGRGLGEIFVVKIFDLKLSKHPYHIGYIQVARDLSGLHEPTGLRYARSRRERGTPRPT